MISRRSDFVTWVRKFRRLGGSPLYIHGFPSITSWDVSIIVPWRQATSSSLNITFLSWNVFPARLNWRNFSTFCQRSRAISWRSAALPHQRPAMAVAARVPRALSLRRVNHVVVKFAEVRLGETYNVILVPGQRRLCNRFKKFSSSSYLPEYSPVGLAILFRGSYLNRFASRSVRA